MQSVAIPRLFRGCINLRTYYSTIEQGDSHREVIICFVTTFKLTVHLTVIESDVDFGIYLSSLS